MAGLGKTAAKLLRQRRQWQKVFDAAAKTGAATTPGATAGRLTETEAFGLNPGNLRMLGYLPNGLPPGAPLVVILHGCTQTAEAYDEGAGWSALADRHGFAVLAPEQRRANNQNLCFNWFQPADTRRDSGEVASIRNMVEHMISTHRLDRSRVFVTGLSAGGAMTGAMLAAYPDLFAGGAIIAGLPHGTASNVQEALDAMFQGKQRGAVEWGDEVRHASAHQGPWPRVSIWHGSADRTVVPSNADELVKQWTDVHGLRPADATTSRVDGQRRRVWRDSSGRVQVESYTIGGLGHGTPIAAGPGDMNVGQAGPHIIEAGISSSHRIAEFWELAAPAADQPVRATSAQPPQAGKSVVPSVPARARGAGSAAPQDGRRAARSSSREDARTKPGSVGRIDPEAVITKALRAAGLLK